MNAFKVLLKCAVPLTREEVPWGYLSQLHSLVFECLGRKPISDESFSAKERIGYLDCYTISYTCLTPTRTQVGKLRTGPESKYSQVYRPQELMTETQLCWGC